MEVKCIWNWHQKSGLGRLPWKTVKNESVSDETFHFYCSWLLRASQKRYHNSYCPWSPFTNKNFYFDGQNIFFELCRKVTTINNIYNYIFCEENVLSVFSELPSISLILYYIKMCCFIVAWTNIRYQNKIWVRFWT